MSSNTNDDTLMAAVALNNVACITLLAVPPDERRRHLEVLAALARSIGTDPDIQTQLYHAKSPAHVHEILHAEEFEDYNYFLEEESA